MFRYLLASFISLAFFYNATVNAKQQSSANNLKVVIHVTDSANYTYRATLNYVDSLQEKFGDKISITIVANGPGIGLVNSKNKYKVQTKKN